MSMRARNRRLRGDFPFDPSPKNREYQRPPPPSHRHSGPSAPWPWINLTDETDPYQLATTLPPIPEACDHSECEGKCWQNYPQSRFPNWTPSQVKRSRISSAIHDYDKNTTSIIYVLDVNHHGLFINVEHMQVAEQQKDRFWNTLVSTHRPPNTRARVLFVENMSGPVLQMLGAKYNIEPFFFSSSLSWIPSRFQEEVRPGRGDHITVTLMFLRPVDNDILQDGKYTPHSSSTSLTAQSSRHEFFQAINTQQPLELYSSDTNVGCSLVLDLLAIHLVRNTEGNTMISYHDKLNEATSAQYLHERLLYAGQSVYWQNILQRSQDPTFLLLLVIWHAMYAWDESLEILYNHICSLETQVLSTSNITITRELHLIRAHLLHYASLLGDLKKTVVFILDTENPAMEVYPEAERQLSRLLLVKECNNLLLETDRLESSRQMQDKRLKNVMNLVFSSVNIGDSRRMQELTEAAVRDSAAMKQIAYLTMVFLPASFVAAVFGMNVKEISPDTKGSLPHYVETALPLTCLTIWIIMAFQSKYMFRKQTTFWSRLAWPWLLVKRIFVKDDHARNEDLSASFEMKVPHNSLSTFTSRL